MEIIDINCMIGEWGFCDLRYKTHSGLLNEMDRLGIGKAFVFHSTAWLCDHATGNDETVDCTSGSERLLPVMVLTSMIDYEFGGREQVTAYIRKHNIKAVRLSPFDDNYTLDIWNIEKLFTLLGDMRMPVLLEYRGNSGPREPHFSDIYELCTAFPDVPVILLNPGYRSLRIYYELFEKCPNFRVESSTLIPFRAIEDIVGHFGSERILYGSRMPFMECGVSLGRLLYADIDDNDRANIAGKNITGLMNNIRLSQV